MSIYILESIINKYSTKYLFAKRNERYKILLDDACKYRYMEITKQFTQLQVITTSYCNNKHILNDISLYLSFSYKKR